MFDRLWEYIKKYILVSIPILLGLYLIGFQNQFVMVLIESIVIVFTAVAMCLYSIPIFSKKFAVKIFDLNADGKLSIEESTLMVGFIGRVCQSIIIAVPVTVVGIILVVYNG